MILFWPANPFLFFVFSFNDVIVWYSWVIYCFTIGSSGAPSIDFTIFSSIGTFSVVVIIFVCFINEVVVPSWFIIISSTGLVKFSMIFLGFIVCPGTKSNVFSSCLFTTETFNSFILLLFILILLIWLWNSFCGEYLFSWNSVLSKSFGGVFCWVKSFGYWLIFSNFLCLSIICLFWSIFSFVSYWDIGSCFIFSGGIFELKFSWFGDIWFGSTLSILFSWYIFCIFGDWDIWFCLIFLKFCLSFFIKGLELIFCWFWIWDILFNSAFFFGVILFIFCWFLDWGICFSWSFSKFALAFSIGARTFIFCCFWFIWFE